MISILEISNNPIYVGALLERKTKNCVAKITEIRGDRVIYSVYYPHISAKKWLNDNNLRLEDFKRLYITPIYKSSNTIYDLSE